MAPSHSSPTDSHPFVVPRPFDEVVMMTPIETIAHTPQEPSAMTPFDDPVDFRGLLLTPGHPHGLFRHSTDPAQLVADARQDLSSPTKGWLAVRGHSLPTFHSASANGEATAPIIKAPRPPRRHHTRKGSSLFSTDDHDHEEAQSEHPHFHLQDMLHDVVEHMHESSSDTEEMGAPQEQDDGEGERVGDNSAKPSH